MKKDIYLITNNINKKCYVGQSINPEYRFRKHKEAALRERTYRSAIYDAMKKYGVENFSLSILESDIENYNEREQYWIEKLDTLIPNGYNISIGGESYPTMKGINHQNATITSQETLDFIYEALQFSDLTEEQIAKEVGSSQAVISDINHGKSYVQEGYLYPLRKVHLDEEEVNELKQDLLFSLDMSYQDIADKYNLSKVQVKVINYGKSWYDSSLDYPLRRYDRFESKENPEIVEQIQQILLSSSKESYEAIGKKFGCSRATVIRINKGEIGKKENLTYPLRTYYLRQSEVDEIHNLLLTSELSMREIGDRFGVADTTIKRMNKGETKKYFNPSLKYPLRELLH